MLRRKCRNDLTRALQQGVRIRRQRNIFRKRDARDDNVIAIIGGGMIGICCALSLQEGGLPVEIIDRAGGDDQRASYGNAGNLSPWPCVPASVPGWRRDPPGPMAVRAAHLPAAAPWLMRRLAAGRIARVGRQADALHSLQAPVVDPYEDLLRPTGQMNLIRRCVRIALYRDIAKAGPSAPGWRSRRERGAELRRIFGRRTARDRA